MVRANFGRVPKFGLSNCKHGVGRDYRDGRVQRGDRCEARVVDDGDNEGANTHLAEQPRIPPLHIPQRKNLHENVRRTQQRATGE